jgi:hypothetical protein
MGISGVRFFERNTGTKINTSYGKMRSKCRKSPASKSLFVVEMPRFTPKVALGAAVNRWQCCL